MPRRRRPDRRVDQFQADGLIGGIALEIHKRMVAGVTAHVDLVAAEVGGVAFARDQLQSDNLGGEADRGVEVLRAEARVADVVEVDHLGAPSDVFAGPARGGSSRGFRR